MTLLVGIWIEAVDENGKIKVMQNNAKYVKVQAVPLTSSLTRQGGADAGWKRFFYGWTLIKQQRYDG
ncbi:MAG: hypothetical protein LWX83_06620 [Anaerolineae bacterium]|nr:hypothetical protein [Anaerolineae bacterium]